MFDYPFGTGALPLIIRAVVSQEGLALRLDPNFRSSLLPIHMWPVDC